jgi:hypothetical protein
MGRGLCAFGFSFVKLMGLLDGVRRYQDVEEFFSSCASLPLVEDNGDREPRAESRRATLLMWPESQAAQTEPCH